MTRHDEPLPLTPAMADEADRIEAARLAARAELMRQAGARGVVVDEAGLAVFDAAFRKGARAMPRATRITASKAHAAAAGGGVGAALAALAVSLLDLDPAIGAPLGIVLTAGLSWLATYFGPENREVAG